MNEHFDALQLDIRTPMDVDSVGALIVTPDGRYLMQLRDNKPGLTLRDHWGLFGGEIEPGENREAALRREIQEELDHSIGACRWYYTHAYVG